jgi:hypothetical protein
MTGRRAIVGLCLLWALAFSAFAAQSASAATKGTTAFTCKETSEGTGEKFSKAHCKQADTSPSGKFRHVDVKEGTQTEVEVTNANTNAETNGSTVVRFHSTLAGVKFELQATGATGTGTVENRKDPVTGEHYVHAQTSTKYTGVTEALLGCEVFGLPGGKGVIETNKLTTTTAGQGDAGKLVPEAGGVFTEFEAKGPAGCPGTVKVFGSVKGVPDGATISSTASKVTEEKTLRIGNATTGPLAGIGVTTTFKGRDKAAGDTQFTPLSATTIETP